MQAKQRLMMDEIVRGIDELGVLLMGHRRGAYWYGSRLSIEEARALAPHNNATSLQVTAAVLGGVVLGHGESAPWNRGTRRDRPRAHIGDRPALSRHGAWCLFRLTPLLNRGGLFPEALDTSDPWQFENFRVV